MTIQAGGRKFHFRPSRQAAIIAVVAGGAVLVLGGAAKSGDQHCVSDIGPASSLAVVSEVFQTKCFSSLEELRDYTGDSGIVELGG